jgi:NADH-quinone oxidoreductase subunit K
LVGGFKETKKQTNKQTNKERKKERKKNKETKTKKQTKMNETLELNHFIILSALLFCIGLSGIFINRKNIISLLMSIELMLLAVNINFVASSAFLHDLVGQVFAIFILTVAGAEAAVGLAIMVIYFNNNNDIEVKNISSMKG